jgi:hypothetical protein
LLDRGVEVLQDSLDEPWLLDTRDHPKPAATAKAAHDVDVIAAFHDHCVTLCKGADYLCHLWLIRSACEEKPIDNRFFAQQTPP